MAARRKKATRKGRDSKGRFKKGWYQPCTPKARIRKAKKGTRRLKK